VTVRKISRRPSPSPRVWTDGRTYGRTDGRSLARSYADVITKFSRLDGLPIFLTHGASLARFARWSSAIICLLYIFWEMTRQENNNLVYPLQFAWVRKKMFRLLYLKMRSLPPLFFLVFCWKGLCRQFCVCKILVKCKRCIHLIHIYSSWILHCLG